MPWLTPEEIPEGDDCRPLSIPASSEWLAIVSGALLELTRLHNWEAFGSVTRQQAVDRMLVMFDNYYAADCSDCTTPGGYRVVRLNEDGQVEQLNSSGEWEAGTGDYYIPPPAARTGGSEQDQICLAAKNAVNVLAELYESLSDSWNNSLDNHEMLTAAIAVIGTSVAFAFAPITWAIAAFALVIMAGAYAALEYIGADLWTNDVSNQITCFLQDCATNDGGVVTFDYWCFIDKLNSMANEFSLTEGQLRLYVQIGYLFYFIGGIDGLNLAGGTTAITSDDCSFCDCSGTSVNFSAGTQGFVNDAWGAYPSAGTHMTNVYGTGWYADGSGGGNVIGISGDVAKVCGNGLNVNGQLSPGGAVATLQVRVTTATQVKNATWSPTAGIFTDTVFWDEGGSLDEADAFVEIGFAGSSGYGIMVQSFQTGDL